MSAWSLTNLNTRSPSMSNLSAHVDLFLLVRVYLSSPSLPGLRSADVFSAAYGVHIAFIVCICMPSRPAANATFRRWSSCLCFNVWSSLTRFVRWDPQALALCNASCHKLHKPPPNTKLRRMHIMNMAYAYAATQNSFLVISSLFCQAREPPGTSTLGSRLDWEALNMREPYVN